MVLSTCVREENVEKITTPHCANRQRFYPDIFTHKFQSVICYTILFGMME